MCLLCAPSAGLDTADRALNKASLTELLTMGSIGKILSLFAVTHWLMSIRLSRAALPSHGWVHPLNYLNVGSLLVGQKYLMGGTVRGIGNMKGERMSL